MTRWIKVYRDLWVNRSRTILIILSIAAGVFAIGLIGMAQQALTESLNGQYADMRPADVILQTEPNLDDEFVESIRHMRGVDEAEGRRFLRLRISPDGQGETWRDLTLYALQDYNDQRLFYVREQDGTWPPPKGEVLLERASLPYLGVKPGQQILVKTPDGRKFHLTVTGRAHDLYRIPPFLEGWVYGYVNMDTIRWMGEPGGYNELYLDAGATTDAEIRALANEAEDRIEGQGLPVYQKTLPAHGEHPLNYIITTVLILLGLVAALSMFLSAMLVINVISALIAQQERQVGIMKAIGARSWQIIGLYFGMVLFLGLMACLIAIPFSYLGANALAAFVAGLINFDPPEVEFTPQALLFQFGVGLLIPIFAAAPVILNGTQVSPAKVLSEYGISQAWGGAGLVDAILRRFPLLTRDLLLESLDQHAVLLYEVAGRLNTIIDLETALREVANLLRVALGADKCEVILSEKFGQLSELGFPTTIARMAIDQRSAVVIPDLSAQQPENIGLGKSALLLRIRSVMCVPILSGEEIAGLIYVYKTRPLARPFDQRDLQLAVAISHQAALTIQRTRLLKRIRQEQRIRGLLQRFFAAPDAEVFLQDFLQTGRLPELAEQNLTVLFTDICDSTGLAERLGAWRFSKILSRYYQDMTGAVFEQGGLVNKYLGDGLMAVFGVTRNKPKPEERAVHAALEMLRRLEALSQAEGEKLEVGIGVNTGPAIAGYLGTEERVEYTVLGDAVNVAQRLQEQARPNRVFVGAATRQAIDANLNFRSVGQVELRGRTEPIETFEVLRS